MMFPMTQDDILRAHLAQRRAQYLPPQQMEQPVMAPGQQLPPPNGVQIDKTKLPPLPEQPLAKPVAQLQPTVPSGFNLPYPSQERPAFNFSASGIPVAQMPQILGQALDAKSRQESAWLGADSQEKSAWMNAMARMAEERESKSSLMEQQARIAKAQTNYAANKDKYGQPYADAEYARETSNVPPTSPEKLAPVVGKEMPAPPTTTATIPPASLPALEAVNKFSGQEGQLRNLVTTHPGVLDDSNMLGQLFQRMQASSVTPNALQSQLDDMALQAALANPEVYTPEQSRIVDVLAQKARERQSPMGKFGMAIKSGLSPIPLIGPGRSSFFSDPREVAKEVDQMNMLSRLLEKYQTAQPSQ